MEGDVITLQDVFTFDYRAGVDANGTYRGTLRGTGLRPRFVERLAERGISIPPEIFRLQGQDRWAG
jgi:pilus assembly protein CpaF